MRMKNFIFKSSNNSDLLKIFTRLESIQAEQRHARYDLTIILKKLDIVVKGVALMVSAPEEEHGINQDIPEGG